jgi:hypothetical protein
VKLDLQPILTVTDIPSGIAVHGTSRKAWLAICQCFSDDSVYSLEILTV